MANVIPTRLFLIREVLRSRIGNAVKGLFVLLIAGTAGYYVLGLLHAHGVLEPTLDPRHEWSLLDCFYFTTITVSTVGYGETLPVPEPGGTLQQFPDVRIYTIGLLLLGMILTAYFLSSATAFFVEGDLNKVLERRRMLTTIAALRGHYLICGAGQTGRHIAEELWQSRKDCVLLDDDPKNIEILVEHRRLLEEASQKEGQKLDLPKVLSITGDATRDETLIEAGIEHAQGLAAVLSDDKDNLFLVISARQLNPKLRIISKAVDKATAAKLLKAGADGVVSTAHIGGLRMASELVRPAVVTFLDQMLRSKEAPVRFAEVRVGPGLAGVTLGSLDVHGRCGLPVLAMRAPGQGFEYNPRPEAKLSAGTVLVVMGEVSKVEKLEKIVGDDRPPSEALVGTKKYQPPAAGQ